MKSSFVEEILHSGDTRKTEDVNKQDKIGESNYINIEFIEHNVDLWSIIGA